MGIKLYSIQTLAIKGLIPSVIYAGQNPNRIVNPLWTLIHTFQGTVAGYATTRTAIEKFPFATNANATDVGDLSTAVQAVGQQN